MRILIVSNLYPPHYVGGYELHCSQVAKFLHESGHEVRVLSSSYGVVTDRDAFTKPAAENLHGIPVERTLHYRTTPEPTGRFYTLQLATRQLQDIRRFIQLLDEFRPTVVSWWSLEGLTKTILPIPAARGIPDVHYVADTWMIREFGLDGENDSSFWFPFWQANWGPSFFRPLLRRILAPWETKVQREGIPTRPFRHSPTHVFFVSEFMRYEYSKAGLVFPSSEVIYNGVTPERFHAQRKSSDFETERLRLLYAGYVTPDRGLHTIIEALALLPEDLRERVELSVADSGAPSNSRYVKDIHTRIHRLGLSKRVFYLGKIPHDDMPRIYQEHHILVFASTLPEGLGLVTLEAMSAGCAVISTGSGGAAEVADRADLPLFPKDHPVALSRLVAKLAKNRQLIFEIGRRGQEVVLREFAFVGMAERFRDTLQILSNQKERNEEFCGSARL